MSTFFVTTNQTSTRTLGAGDAILIGRTGGISVPGDHAVEALGTDNATRAQIDGHVYGYASGVHMSGTSLGDGDYSGTGDHSVNIGAEGTVIGMGTTSGHAGVFMAGTGGTVVNHGSVSGVWNGITLHGAGGFVSNTGWVSGQSATGVELRGFGAFSVKRRDARVGRNPRTGDSVNVEEKHVPFFKTGKLLRDRLNGRA